MFIVSILTWCFGPVIRWIGRLSFRRLVKLAMWIGSKAFNDKWDMKVHGVKSRRWMWANVWKPYLIDKAKSTPSVFDDGLAEYAYWNQMLWIDDPESVQAKQLTEVIQRLKVVVAKGGDGVSDVEIALQKAMDLARELGMDL